MGAAFANVHGMTVHRMTNRWGLAVLLSSLLMACSDNDGAGNNINGDPDGSINGNDGSFDPDVTADPDGGFNVDGSAIEVDPGDGPVGDACIGVTSEAKLIPLDMYVMYDQSGSMDEKTGTGGSSPTKWTAAKSAFFAFLADPASTGLGVGIQYFAYYPPGIPSTCTAEADCKTYGPCATNKACDKESVAAGVVMPCTSNTDCKSGGNCVDVGICSNNPAAGCFTNLNCLTPGKCTFPKHCQMRECKASDYATPEVPIAPLPGNRTAIETSLNAHKPISDTPTGPALAGAIQHAQTWAKANPTRAVIALLVTDGEPTACTPIAIADIAKLASDARAGTPSIRTYVIGVLGSKESPANLHTISMAGNGANAFIVNTSADVTKEFQAALNAIRGTALACEYALPSSVGADYFKVNVKVTSGGSTTTIPYVGTVAKCDATTGGWYYDTDPAATAPTKILMCPATCSKFKATPGGKLDIEVGCKTVSIVK
jgi:hypothetical protein